MSEVPGQLDVAREAMEQALQDLEDVQAEKSKVEAALASDKQRMADGEAAIAERIAAASAALPDMSTRARQRREELEQTRNGDLAAMQEQAKELDREMLIVMKRLREQEMIVKMKAQRREELEAEVTNLIKSETVKKDKEIHEIVVKYLEDRQQLINKIDLEVKRSEQCEEKLRTGCYEDVAEKKKKIEFIKEQHRKGEWAAWELPDKYMAHRTTSYNSADRLWQKPNEGHPEGLKTDGQWCARAEKPRTDFPSKMSKRSEAFEKKKEEQAQHYKKHDDELKENVQKLAQGKAAISMEIKKTKELEALIKKERSEKEREIKRLTTFIDTTKERQERVKQDNTRIRQADEVVKKSNTQLSIQYKQLMKDNDAAGINQDEEEAPLAIEDAPDGGDGGEAGDDDEGAAPVPAADDAAAEEAAAGDAPPEDA